MPSNGPATLFLVDDDPLYARVPCKVLVSAGYTVKIFESASLLLNDPESLERCDLIISDINTASWMSPTSGFGISYFLGGTSTSARVSKTFSSGVRVPFD